MDIQTHAAAFDHVRRTPAGQGRRTTRAFHHHAVACRRQCRGKQHARILIFADQLLEEVHLLACRRGTATLGKHRIEQDHIRRRRTPAAQQVDRITSQQVHASDQRTHPPIRACRCARETIREQTPDHGMAFDQRDPAAKRGQHGAVTPPARRRIDHMQLLLHGHADGACKILVAGTDAAQAIQQFRGGKIDPYRRPATRAALGQGKPRVVDQQREMFTHERAPLAAARCHTGTAQFRGQRGGAIHGTVAKCHHDHCRRLSQRRILHARTDSVRDTTAIAVVRLHSLISCCKDPFMNLKCTVTRPGGVLVLLAAVLAGCAGYEYTLNERTLFGGPELFADYAIADEALRECVAQAIADQRITHAEALKDLICTHAGITRLDGLQVFTGLTRLGLDDNAIADLTPLYALPALELLQLRGNRLRTIDTAICRGSATKSLALAGNEELDCASIDQLRACGARLTDVPEHCGNASP